MIRRGSRNGRRQRKHPVKADVLASVSGNAISAHARPLRCQAPQQDSFKTSIVNACAASLMPSEIVRYGHQMFAI